MDHLRQDHILLSKFNCMSRIWTRSSSSSTDLMPAFGRITRQPIKHTVCSRTWRWTSTEWPCSGALRSSSWKPSRNIKIVALTSSAWKTSAPTQRSLRTAIPEILYVKLNTSRLWTVPTVNMKIFFSFTTSTARWGFTASTVLWSTHHPPSCHNTSSDVKQISKSCLPSFEPFLIYPPFVMIVIIGRERPSHAFKSCFPKWMTSKTWLEIYPYRYC